MHTRTVLNMDDSWLSGMAYERFMGRWSTLVAQEFLPWLAVPVARHWLDVGCGTGALTKLVLKTCHPAQVVAVDSSSEFVLDAQRSITDPRAQFRIGQAEALDFDSSTFDAVVSGLALNFVSQPKAAVSEMMRVAKPDGAVGIFLWDYAEDMQMLRYFWDAAVDLDDEARKFDEGIRFPICQEGQLESLVRTVGLKQVEATAIEIPTFFRDFDAYWQPFLGGVGPAPGYVLSLDQEKRQSLEDRLRRSLPVENDGSISLIARAWAVKGRA